MFFLLVLSVLYCNLRFYSNITQYYDTNLLTIVDLVQSVLQTAVDQTMLATGLKRLARKYLAIPATSAPSERVFSLAGNICSRRRASLSPDHLYALVFLIANGDLITE